jgi:hypothetical protein
MFTATFRTLLVTAVHIKIQEVYDSVIPVVDSLLDTEDYAFFVSSIKIIIYVSMPFVSF